MLRIIFALLILLAWAAPSLADSQVEISAKDCRRLVRHMPSGDVTYKPGVDVRGKKVKSADLDSVPRIKIPEILNFSLDLDLSDYGIASQTSVGVITFDLLSGELFYNGQALSGAAEAELALKCREIL